MDWLKVGSALLLVMMLVYLWPRAMHMIKNSPKGSSKDWQAAIIPIALVIAFVFLLVAMV